MTNQKFINIFKDSQTNWKYILIVFILALFVGGGTLWFLAKQGLPYEPPEIKKPEKVEEEATKLTLEAIENTEYYFYSYQKRAQFVNGEYGEEVIDEYGFRSVFAAGIVSDKVAFGDLNYDGKEDATVIVYSTGGGSGVFYELAIIINKNGTPYYLASKTLGDRVKINSVTIQGGEINLDMVVHSPGDSMCCPTLNKIFKYKVINNQILDLTETVN